MPALYVVATPIGNLEDVTLRALRVLRQVGLIAAEDTRTTRKLLNHYGIKTPLTSYHDHNRKVKIPLLTEALETKDVALVSEAGMPGISDPGYELVRAAIGSGVQVVPIPGPSAVTTALAVSGLPAGGFLFLGFLPRRSGQRRRLLESIRAQPHTLLAFESPHRLAGSLKDGIDVLGDRPIAVCREITKVHEEMFWGTMSEALTHFSGPSGSEKPRGEFTLVIGGGDSTASPSDPEWARGELQRLKAQGLKARDAVAVVAQASGLSRREVYQLWLAVGPP